jgi:hypothetical protein
MSCSDRSATIGSIRVALREIDHAASKITVYGARYPELRTLVGR